MSLVEVGTRTLPNPRLQGVVTPASFASEVFRHAQLVVETESAVLTDLAAKYGPKSEQAARLVGHSAWWLVTWLRYFHGSRMQFLARPTPEGLRGLNESWLRMLWARRSFDRSLEGNQTGDLLPRLYDYHIHFSFAGHTDNCWMRVFRDLVVSHLSDLQTFTKQHGHGSLPKIPENGLIFGPEFEFFPAEAVKLIDAKLNQIPDLDFASRATAAIASGQANGIDEPTAQQRQVEFWRNWRTWIVSLLDKVNKWNDISGKKQAWDAVSPIVNDCTNAWGQVHHRWHDARPTKPTPEDFWALDDGVGTLPPELSNAVRDAKSDIDKILATFVLMRKDDCNRTTLKRISKVTFNALESVAKRLSPFEEFGGLMQKAPDKTALVIGTNPPRQPDTPTGHNEEKCESRHAWDGDCERCAKAYKKDFKAAKKRKARPQSLEAFCAEFAEANHIVGSTLAKKMSLHRKTWDANHEFSLRSRRPKS